MRFVTEAAKRPYHCAAFPHLGKTHKHGYFDTGTTLDGPGVFGNHIYLSVEAVEEGARHLGWTSPEELGKLVGENERLESENRELGIRVAAQQAELDAIDIIESAGFRARKKPGRPKAAA